MKAKKEIIRIKKLYKIEDFKVFCHFSNGEYKFIDFKKLFKKWNIKKNDIEYPLLDKKKFQKVSLINGALSWTNTKVVLLDQNNEEKEYPYQIDPITVYQNSQFDQEKLVENLGILLKNERVKSGLSKKELAKKSGISEEYISKLENNKSNIELLIIRDIIKNGFGKNLKISIE